MYSCTIYKWWRLENKRMEKTEEKEVNFGRSVIVPSVVELAKQPLTTLPPRYLRHCSASAHPLSTSSAPPVPVIDLNKLLSQTPSSTELLNLHSACKTWGFFQVINHGVSSSIMEAFKTQVVHLFELPMDQKKILWQKPDNHEGFGQLFVVSEQQKLDWSDMFYVTTLPPTLRRSDLFHNLPPHFRDAMEEYIGATETLALTLLGQMAKALGIEKTEMDELFRQGLQSIRLNYYPPCPEPDKAIGFAPHSDADALTIVFQLNNTQGLEILKDGNWVPVEPLENAFVVNIGDIMEIVSNGVYRSIEHRATVNSTKERLSVATFYSPNLESELGPARSVIGPDNPPVFRTERAELYHKGFFARKLSGKSYLQEMKLQRLL